MTISRSFMLVALMTVSACQTTAPEPEKAVEKNSNKNRLRASDSDSTSSEPSTSVPLVQGQAGPRAKAPIALPEQSCRFVLSSGVTPQGPLKLIFVTELTSLRCVAMTFYPNNNRLEIIAGRELANDLRGPLAGNPAPNAAPLNPPGFIVYSTEIAAGVSALIVIDEERAKMCIYTVDLVTKRFEVRAVEDLRRLFR